MVVLSRKYIFRIISILFLYTCTHTLLFAQEQEEDSILGRAPESESGAGLPSRTLPEETELALPLKITDELEPKKTEEPAPKKSSAIPLSFPLKIPHLGEFLLQGSIDMGTQAFEFKVGYKEVPQIDLGLVKFSESPKVGLSSKKGIFFTASVDLFFGLAKGVLALEELKPDHALFSIGLEKPIPMPLAPWLAIPIPKFYLYLSKTEQRVYARIQLDATDPTSNLTFTFGFDKKSHYAECAVDNLNLSLLLPELKKNPIGKLGLTKGTIRIANPLNPKADHITFIQSQIDLTPITATLPPIPNFNLREVRSEILIDPKNGFRLSIGLGATLPIIPTLCELKNPTLVLSKYAEGVTPPAGLPMQAQAGAIPGQAAPAAKTAVAPAPAETKQKTTAAKQLPPIPTTKPGATKYKPVILTLTGFIDVIIPPDIATFTIGLTSTFKDGKFQTLEGNLDTPVKFLDFFTLQGSTITLTPNGITLKTRALIEKVDAAVTVSLLKKVVDGKSILDFEFKGEAAQQNPIKPFEKIEALPKEFKDISLSKLGIGFSATTRTFFMQGTATILGLPVTAKLMAGPKYMALRAGVDKFKLADVVPGIEKTFINDIELPTAELVVSTGRFKDPDSGISYKPGLNVVASIEASGPLKVIRQYLPGIPPKLQLAASVGTSLQDLAIEIFVPGGFEIPNVLRFGTFILEITGDGPSVSLVCKIDIKPTPSDDWLSFSGRIRLDADSASGAASMEGMWNNPLGFPGFAFGNLALELGFDYNIASTTFSSIGIPLPSIVGITGEMRIGEATAKGALKMTIGTSIGALLDQVLQLKVTSMTLRDVAMQYNNMAQIAGLPPASQIPLELVPKLGFKDVEIYLCPKGAKIGEIAFDAGIRLSGMVQLFDKFAMIKASIGMDGITAQGSVSKLDIGPLHITGAGLDGKYGTEDDGPAVSFILRPDKQEILLSGEIEFLGNRSKTELHVTTRGISFYTNTKLLNLFEVMLEGKSVGSGSDLDFVIAGEFRNDFYDFIKKGAAKLIMNAKQDAIKNLQKAQAEVAKLNNDIAGIQNQINMKKYGITQNDRVMLRLSVLDKRRFDLTNANSRLHIEIAGLEVGRQATIAARDIAIGFLKAAEQLVKSSLGTLGQEIAKVGVQYISAFIEKQIIIKRATIKGSALNIFKKGIMPTVVIELIVFGKKLAPKELTLNFSDPASFVNQISKVVLAAAAAIR